jgi:hypothetical protein
MALTKEQARLRQGDPAWTNGTIKELRESRSGWSITTSEGSGFFLSRDALNGAAAPKVGDAITLYTHRGMMIRGIDLRGEPLFYKTQAELDHEQEEWVANNKTEKKERFEKNRRKLDRQFAALPDVFQRRISWFRAWNPDFRWENEAYEMVCCVDAVKIAEAMRTPKGVERFRKASHKKQRELVPDFDDGHSGNSFGMAVRLAWLYLTDPLLVFAEHGALTPLVGCDDYGCVHPRPADVIEALKADETKPERKSA